MQIVDFMKSIRNAAVYIKSNWWKTNAKRSTAELILMICVIILNKNGSDFSKGGVWPNVPLKQKCYVLDDIVDSTKKFHGWDAKQYIVRQDKKLCTLLSQES